MEAKQGRSDEGKAIMMRLGSTGHDVIDSGFFRDADLDYATRGVLGRAVHGASEIGEVLATIARVRHASDWVTQWRLTAESVQRQAERQLAAGHRVSARSSYLRAATYWSCVSDGLASESDEDALLAAFRAGRSAWEHFIDCFEGAHVRVGVDYEAGTLPGYLMRPDATGQPRPTLVVTSGSDAAINDLWSTIVAGGLDRGWNVFVYDGPGQQSMLFEHGVPFRPDWEAVLTPVVDTLVDRADVIGEQLAGYGLSQGGYWLPRALAFEHRFAAAVVDPGVVDVSTSWTAKLSKGMIEQLHSGDRKRFNQAMGLATHLPGLARTLTYRARPYPHTDWFDLYSTVLQYRLDAETAALISTPLLITEPEGEQFWPGQSAELAALVPDSEVSHFTVAQGAELHCQPLARLQTDARIFDWLEDRLGITEPAPEDESAGTR